MKGSTWTGYRPRMSLANDPSRPKCCSFCDFRYGRQSGLCAQMRYRKISQQASEAGVAGAKEWKPSGRRERPEQDQERFMEETGEVSQACSKICGVGQSKSQSTRRKSSSDRDSTEEGKDRPARSE